MAMFSHADAIIVFCIQNKEVLYTTLLGVYL